MDRPVVYTAELDSLARESHRGDDSIHGPMFRVWYGDAAPNTGRSELLASDNRVGNAFLFGVGNGSGFGQAAYHGPNRHISAGGAKIQQYRFRNHECELVSQWRQVIFAAGCVAARRHPLEAGQLSISSVGATLAVRFHSAGGRSKSRHRVHASFHRIRTFEWGDM